jgi:hypothetical protein
LSSWTHIFLCTRSFGDIHIPFIDKSKVGDEKYVNPNKYRRYLCFTLQNDDVSLFKPSAGG